MNMQENEDPKDNPIKDIVDKGKENIKNTKENILNSLDGEGNENIFAALSYVPVIGLIIVYLFKKHQKFAMAHARNSAYVQLTFGTIWFAIWFLVNIPLISTILKAIMFVPVITNALMYVNIIFLAGASVYGAYMAYQNKIWETPYLYSLIDKYLGKSSPNRKKSKE